MSRISLNDFILAGLLVWGIPAAFVAGPVALVYILAAALPVWLFRLRNGAALAPPEQRFSSATGTVLASFALIYLLCDAIFGLQFWRVNLFLFGAEGTGRLVEQTVLSMGKGGGVAYLLYGILFLLPFASFDAARNMPRAIRYVLWAIAALFVVYEMGSGRAFLFLSVLCIVLGQTSNWRRILVGAVLALAAFGAASAIRGDLAGPGTQTPLLQQLVAPFVNLALLTHSSCGSAPWYSFIAEFFKKLIPAFLFPKTVFSFNAEMSLCIYPSDPNLTNGVSVFTWLGEIFYYRPSLVTALIAGLILGALGRVVDRLLIRNGLQTARNMAGFLCFLLPRSRTQDLFSFLLAQLIFFLIFWPALCGLPRYLRRFLIAPHSAPPAGEPSGDAAQ